MTVIFILLSVLTLAASSYVSYACFCIVHRMTKRTAWSLAIGIITISAVAAYGFLQSLAHLAGLVPSIPPVLILMTLLAALVLSQMPRVET